MRGLGDISELAHVLEIHGVSILRDVAVDRYILTDGEGRAFLHPFADLAALLSAIEQLPTIRRKRAAAREFMALLEPHVVNV